MPTVFLTGDDGKGIALPLCDWLLPYIELKKPGEVDFFCGNVCNLTEASDLEDARDFQLINIFNILVEGSEVLFLLLQESLDQGHLTILNGEVKQNKAYLEFLKEVEEFYFTLISLLSHPNFSSQAEDVGKATRKLAALFADGSGACTLRLRLLQGLYNVSENDGKLKFFIMMTILNYAERERVYDQILHYIKYLDDWKVQWSLTAEQEREFHYLLYKQLSVFGSKVDAYQYLKRYVMGFNGEQESILSKENVIEASLEFLVSSVVNPSVMYFDDILEFDSISYLKKVDKYALLIRLCELIVGGSPTDYDNFVAKYKDEIQEKRNDIDLNILRNKVRLLAVASMAENVLELSIAQMAEKLSVDEFEAEDVIAQAIGHGIVDGRIDQLRRVLLVKGVTPRSFEIEQWKKLSVKINKWVVNVNELSKCLQSHKIDENNLVNNLRVVD